MNNVAFAFWVVNISSSVFRWWWMSLFFNLTVVNISAFAFWLVDWFEHLCLSMLIFVYHMFWCEHLCLSQVTAFPFPTGGEDCPSLPQAISLYHHHQNHQNIKSSLLPSSSYQLLPPHYHHNRYCQCHLCVVLSSRTKFLRPISTFTNCLLGPNCSDQYQHWQTVF